MWSPGMGVEGQFWKTRREGGIEGGLEMGEEPRVPSRVPQELGGVARGGGLPGSRTGVFMITSCSLGHAPRHLVSVFRTHGGHSPICCHLGGPCCFAQDQWQPPPTQTPGGKAVTLLRLDSSSRPCP